MEASEPHFASVTPAELSTQLLGAYGENPSERPSLIKHLRKKRAQISPHFLRHLGDGTFRSVDLLKLNLGRGVEDIAVKTLRFTHSSTVSGRKDLRPDAFADAYAQIIASGRSKHVAKIRFVLTSGPFMGTIGMKPYLDGNLYDYVKRRNGFKSSDVNDIQLIVAQVGQAILDMHLKRDMPYRIAHHGLTFENVLLENGDLGPAGGLLVTVPVF